MLAGASHLERKRFVKVTVCELSNDPEEFKLQWQQLVAHVHAHGSDLVLLPEMPFYPWIARTRQFHPSVWEASMKAHDAWISMLDELQPAMVLGTRPVNKAGKRLNEGFSWDAHHGYRAVHTKTYLPEEEWFWEASWYDCGNREFKLINTEQVNIGFLICTELWFNEPARVYGAEGAHLIVCPRATAMASAEKWIAGGRTAAVVSGAFCLSSNRGGTDKHGMAWGGRGWIIDPEEGDVVGLTSPSQPFITLDINLSAAETAKQTYPRYVQ